MLKNLSLILCCSAALVVGGVSYANERNVDLVKLEAEQVAKERKVAIVVGVEKYSSASQLQPLEYAKDDADAIEAALTAQGYKVYPFINTDAGRGDVLNMIEQVGKTLEPNEGTLVFFFSGHGFAQGDKNYLATFGTVKGREASTALALDDVVEEIKKTKVRRAVMFIDACRNQGGKSGADVSFLEQHSEGIKALYSTKVGEISEERPEMQQGIFSYFLKQALQGEPKAAEANGVISFESLSRYVTQETRDWSLEHLRRAQMPYSRDFSDSAGIMVLGRSSQVAQAPELVQPAIPSFPMPKMVRIKGGSFKMGCSNGKECADYEKSVRTVKVPAFEMSKTEVTFAQWDACVAEGGCDGYKPDDEGWGRHDRPVINVSWDDAQNYVQWLSQKTGKKYRLPTEAEWEYAARAGSSTTNYPWGDKASHEYANYGTDECCEGLAQGKDEWVNTSPVGSFAASAWGLHDMHGNVWEWVQDCYKSDYKDLPPNGAAWEAQGCVSRVLRGGSWYSEPRLVRSANRYDNTPTYRIYGAGFRAARTY